MNWQVSKFFQASEDEVVCSLCPHSCTFKRDGDAGKCHVRRRKNMHLETASFATAVQHLDPIERKPLYHYKPAGKVLTLASPGCTFRCLYCQNYRLSQFGRSQEAIWRAEPVNISKIISFAAAHQAAIGFSYAEPSLNAELTLALAEAARPNGIDIIWKTNGFLTPGAAEELAPCLAAVNIDLKSLDAKQHRMLTGAPLAPILETIAIFYEAGVWLEFSTPLIPEFNAAALRRIAAFICSIDPNIPWHLGRFNPDFKLRNLPPTSVEMLAKGRYTAFEAGLKYVYVERALGPEGRTTYCQSCSRPLIIRKLWGLEENFLIDGACPACKTPLTGRWQDYNEI
ncbi:MAG: AmmeMemoRadiSam system radical SAM enzyme [Gammaproteobacteria bacterium]|nr:AmmeMemoRadiSam system radical SAM enzyme [Gammaproteobacteria bacterium]